MRGWLPALRIARREARRAKGRSALVIAMVAVPVLCLSFAAVSYDMLRLTPAETAARQLGAADGRIRWFYDGPAYQDFDSRGSGSDNASLKAAYSEAELLAALPAGSRIVADRIGIAEMRTPAGSTGLDVHGADVADPLFAGRFRVLDGRAPAAAHEVALTERAVGRLGARVGGTVELADGSRTYIVVGVVEFPSNLSPAVVFRPDAVPLPPDHGERPQSQEWLVDTPEPLTWPAVRSLNEKGILVVSRNVMLHRPPESELDPRLGAGFDVVPPQALALGVLVFGLGVLEVVLLAGPAFAVGARRRRRQLALVAANGGTPAHVRRIVLADGVVLGVVAACAGIVLGIAAAFAARPLVEWHFAQARAGGYRVFPLALLAIGGLAVVTGVLGALVPAFVAARQDVVAALSGRRGITRSRKRWLFLGLAMCVLAVAIAGFGAWTVNTNVVLSALVVGELGLVLCTPSLVGLIARAGRFLPLAPRIALRDTARNRAAAAPAISAVMAAVAGAVAVGGYLVSSAARQDSEYMPSMPRGYVAAGYQGEGPAPKDAVRGAVRDTLPVGTMVDVYGYACADKPGCFLSTLFAEENICPYWNAPPPKSRADHRAAKRDRRCAENYAASSSGAFPDIVDDGTVLPLLTGASAAQVEAATAVLRAGGVVVGSDYSVVDGRATIQTGIRGKEAAPPPREFTVPAYVLRVPGRGVGIYFSPSVVERAGLTTQWRGIAASTTRMPTQNEEDRLNRAVGQENSWAIVERGPRRGQDVALLILALAAGVITLGAAGIATGLAAADGRADLSTLAAVGASPRLRRVLSLSQAGVIAGLGALLGAAAGLGSASVILFALNQVYASTWPAPAPFPISVPWQSLGIVLVVVPAVAMLGAGLLTRSRLPIERRLAT